METTKERIKRHAKENHLSYYTSELLLAIGVILETSISASYFRTEDGFAPNEIGYGFMYDDDRATYMKFKTEESLHIYLQGFFDAEMRKRNFIFPN